MKQRKSWVVDGYDVLALVGGIMIGYGLSLVSVPLALCVMGVMLLTVGIAGAWRKGNR